MVLSLAHANLTDQAAVLAAARNVWAESFGPPRAATGDRDRLGTRSAKRREQLNRKSHAAWLRRRRAASTPAAGPDVGPDCLDTAVTSMADALWSDRQTREVARQQQVRKHRKLHSAAEGLEVDAAPEFLAQVAGERAAAARRQRALEAQRRRTATIRNLPAPSDIQGKTVWVDAAVEPTTKERLGMVGPTSSPRGGQEGTRPCSGRARRRAAGRAEPGCCSLARVPGDHA